MKSPKLLIGILLGTTLSLACAEITPAPAESTSVTVPLKLVGDDPLIDIRVNGVAVTVQFDIGISANLSLFPSILEQIDKTPNGESIGGMTPYGPTGKTAIYQVDLVQIGDISFTDVTIGQDFHDAAFQADFIAGKGAHGFAGRGLFLDRKIVIDYQRQELTIVTPDVPAKQQPSCRGREIPLITGRDWGVATKAKTEIGDIVFVWDTGAPANIIFKKRTDAANLNLPEYDALTLDQLSFGGHEFGPANFYVRDFEGPPFDGFIGYAFFVDHVVCIDFPGDRLLIRE